MHATLKPVIVLVLLCLTTACAERQKAIYNRRYLEMQSYGLEMATATTQAASESSASSSSKTVAKPPKKTEIDKLADRIANVEIETEFETEGDRQDREVAIDALKERRNKPIVKAKRKGEDPEVTKARRRREKREKDEKKELKEAAERASNTRTLVNIQGCEPDSVWMNPAIGNQFGLRESTINSRYYITVVNRGGGDAKLTSSHFGDLLRGLCPGGVAHLLFTTRSSDPNSIQIALTATMGSGSGIVINNKTLFLTHMQFSNMNVQSQSEVWELFPSY